MVGLDGIQRVVGNTCAYTMQQEDEKGLGHINTPTGLLTNSDLIAKRVSRKCDGMHRHIELVGGRAKFAQVYPHMLRQEILWGLMDQMIKDGRWDGREYGITVAFEENGIG